MGVIPDLTTMGKIIGGGFPIGAIGGRREIIDQSSPDIVDQVLIGGGTFSGYPLSMIAGLKTLEILNNSHNEYLRIGKEGERLLNKLNQFFNEEKLKIVAIGHKSTVILHALTKWIEQPTMREIFEFKDRKREALFQLALFNRNISGLHGLGYISMAHSHDDIVKIQEVVEHIAPPVSNSKFN